MQQAGQVLVRRPDGFWCVASDDQDDGQRSRQDGEWYTGTQTMHALERRGWIRRTNQKTKEWCDPRELTPAGITLALE